MKKIFNKLKDRKFTYNKRILFYFYSNILKKIFYFSNDNNKINKNNI